jgi:CubicO group peptidase (beta-lactamase class C family)
MIAGMPARPSGSVNAFCNSRLPRVRAFSFSCSMDIERFEALFRENFTRFGELGASVSVWRDGREVIGLSGGWRDRGQTAPWTDETRVLVWSATKGPAVACVLHAMQERAIPLAAPVAEVWPEFARGGKGRITLGEVLSHQSGVPVLERGVSVLDHAAVAEAIAAQEPHWEPGRAHGYGPRLFGFLLDEIVRRITAQPLGAYWRNVFADPLGLDFWIGMPAEDSETVAPVFPPKAAPPRDRFYKAFVTPGSFTIRAFASPEGFQSVASINSREARTASLPGFGGIGTARALGKFYAMLAAGGVLGGRTYFQPSTLRWMSAPLVQGDDRVLLTDTAFSAGFMLDPVSPAGEKQRFIFGPSRAAFGHPGAGGSHAFADPEKRISFAYVMNQMEPGVLPGAKAQRLVDAIYQ